MPEVASLKSLLDEASPEEIRECIEALTPEEAESLLYDWELWARDNQLSPKTDWRYWLCLAGRGWGKALSLDTPLPTPDGWTTMRNIKPGDFVIGADGMPTKVLYATPVQHNRDCYKITFSDNSTIIADADHQWAARSRADRRAGRKYRTVSTRDMLSCLTVAGERNWQMPCMRPMELAEVSLPIDPYLFGVWLGDGDSAGSWITIGDSDANEILRLLPEKYVKAGPLLRYKPEPVKQQRDKRTGRMMANSSLHSRLRLLGVHKNKHIPMIYLRASKTQRLALLEGLIDSDGYVEHSTGKIEITTASKRLSEDIRELALTLGIRAIAHEGRASLHGEDAGAKYRVTWVARSGGGRLARKRLVLRSGLGQPDRATTRYVKSIEPIPSVPVRCITVSAKDSLYVAGRDFLVTHNTRTGSEWIRKRHKAGYGRIAIVGRTAADVRDVMIEGESGLLSIYPLADRPIYQKSNRRVVWSNGAIATCYSADEPDQLRGPQHDTAWADELASWKYPDAWDQLLFGLRLGNDPRAIITTTPRPTKIIKDLIADKNTAIVRGSTFDNKANLADAFVDTIVSKYEGTRLGRQELFAEILDDNPRALWKRDTIESARVKKAPALKRIVVAIDPAVTSNEDSDETGIVAGGVGMDGEYYVLRDKTCIETPNGWAKAAVALLEELKADRIVAEVNNGGDLVEAVLRSVKKNVPYKSVHASRGKVTRAEPVAALYEQGKVHHVGLFPDLEDQMCEWEPGQDSPDRMDALVWLITELSNTKTASVISKDKYGLY